ncbi:MAG: flavin reductase family protein [Gammaproteobacteria bacterium]|nr:flavin reductase family protein [Gammaproteobacteria bacterium]
MQESFKKAMSRFATGVCVVTFENPETGKFDGVTISAFSSVSLSPLKILFCLGNLGTTNSTFANVSSFAVNILNSEQTNLAYKFAGNDYSEIEGSIVNIDELPCIKNSLVTAVCEKGNIYTEGDHDIIIGNVTEIKLGDEKLEPLLYFKSKIIEDYKDAR